MSRLLTVAAFVAAAATAATAAVASTAPNAKEGSLLSSYQQQGEEEEPHKLRTISHFLHMDASKQFQLMDYAGVAITESTAIILMKYMTESQRTELLQLVFGEVDATTKEMRKAHLTAVRVTMGASDFNVDYYSYDDLSASSANATDYDLQYFSIAKDEAVLIPLLKEIKAVNPNVKILATPWSAPGWMKDTGSLLGGSFLGTPCGAASSSSSSSRENRRAGGLLHASSADPCKIFTTYANYFVKYVEAYYTQHGLLVDYLTLQNEPLNSNPTMPSMLLASAVEGPLGDAVAKGLRGLKEKLSSSYPLANAKANAPPAFAVPQLFAFDHNWDNITYPEDVLKTAGERPTDPSPMTPFVGAAFHCYAGDVSAQTSFYQNYTNSKLWMTECCGGSWAPNWADSLHWDAANLYIGNTANYGQSAFKWNLILTEDGGPKASGGCNGCRGVFTYFENNKTYAPEQDWFPLHNFASAASLAKVSQNGGDVKRIGVTIDGMDYPTVATATVNAPSSSSYLESSSSVVAATKKNSNGDTYFTMLLNLETRWCSSGAIHIPLFFSITPPNSPTKVCKALNPADNNRAVQLKILCPSVSATVFVMPSSANSEYILVALDQSFITRNETMTDLRYDQTDAASDWQQYSNWTCV